MPSTATLEQYREYLGLLGRLQLDEQLAGKVDVSGVVQTTMLEAHQHSSTWESLDEEARTAWLRRVFANNLLDEIRRFRAKSRDVSREQSLEQAMEQSASRLNVWLAAKQSSPSHRAVRSEEAVRLATALGCLTPPQREAIELHHLKGMQLAEVGKKMGRDKGAVAALIFRGTKRLRELLGEMSEMMMSEQYSQKHPQKSTTDTGSSAGSGRRVLVIVALTLGSVCLVCCGGPTIAYLAVKSAITSWMEAPATSEPLSPNELVRWYQENKPTQPFVLHDPTRDKVDLIGTVLETNSGVQLRVPSSADEFRQLVKDLDNQWKEKEQYQRYGKAQLIFRGEQDDQEVACWFESAESIHNINPGDEVVVRGRRVFMSTSGSGSKGPFVLELIRCRLIHD